MSSEPIAAMMAQFHLVRGDSEAVTMAPPGRCAGVGGGEMLALSRKSSVSRQYGAPKR